MIPSVLCRQLKQGLEDYIDTTFPISNPVFKDMVRDLLARPGKVFREPYVSLRMPFRTAESEKEWFEAVKLKFPPYVHQEKAFRRLLGNEPQSTLVATGTGSGKTECFLYPILEYCYQHRGEPGIKAILIYPMNALASDQARRLAALIDSNEALRGNVTAGMFVGEKEESPSRTMGEERIITDRDVMKTQPPDILLTNYKMLDYLLIRPNDATLWKNNKPETLKFIVVDELHTFDGAQGTDLACLLRRLKARLVTPTQYLCCVGTSATMGSGDGSRDLLGYATDVFGESFEEHAIITEDRLSAREFLIGFNAENMSFPDETEVQSLAALAQGDGDTTTYLRAAYQAWFGEVAAESDIFEDSWRIELGLKLKKLAFFRDLITEMDNRMNEYGELIEKLANRYRNLRRRSKELNDAALDSIMALVAHARALSTGESPGLVPFLQEHVQVWFRELRRMVASVDAESPVLEMSDDLNDRQKKNYLPVINCRDCGATGWVGMINEGNLVHVSDLTMFYNAFFKNDKKIVMLFPDHEGQIEHTYYHKVKFCPDCFHVNLNFNNLKCDNCGSKRIFPVFLPDLDTVNDFEGKKSGFSCPFCNSGGGLSLIGSQSATLLSAGLSQIYASRFNDDKKLLTFSDSVQDASHRAGFFTARTWRFNLRIAIQKFVADGGVGMNLAEFVKSFTGYWRERLDKETYISTFIPPNMTWKRVFEGMLEKGKLDSDPGEVEAFIEDINKRLELEIFFEYGFNARVGRTLEKSGDSILNVNQQIFQVVIDRLYLRITNEIGELRSCDRNLVARLAISFLTRLKNNGALYKEVFAGFIRENGNVYFLSNKNLRWMPGLTSGKRVPRFLAARPVEKGGKRFDVINSNSWYYSWCEKMLGMPLMREDLPVELYQLMLEELVKLGLLTEEKTKTGVSIWAIDPQYVHISDQVTQISCNYCGHTLSVPGDAVGIWEGMLCHNPDCLGTYSKSREGRDFYGKLYANGELYRIFAAEHTGLIQRDQREKLESEFKKPKDQHKPWYPNLLSCTPTLEMGIDIGDLSTVVLCSVPPTGAQYLQRIGRAGRRDGNALSVVVVNSKPHDLYFYEEPLEMIAGEIQTPGVFLDASAVLERQFTAYCFDCWIKSGITLGAIPKNLSQVLTNLKADAKDKFPFNYLKYIENNLSWLLQGFIGLLDGKLSPESKLQLQNFAQGSGLVENSLAGKIIEGFESIHREREALRKDIKRLDAMIKELGGKPKDQSYEEEMNNLKKERHALAEIVKKSINEKEVFNFLSDEGLLPNYAFPESGIILKAIIYRKLEPKEEAITHRRYQNYVYEYNRPAVAAISEFAPDNSFYAEGRKMKIDQVDLKTTKPELWRLCPSCSHAQLEVPGKDVAECPHCRDTRWADQGQLRQMLRLKMVYANNEYIKSKSADESDVRDQSFFCRQMLVDVDQEKDIVKAYKIDNEKTPFGFEFVKKATLREINFGERESIGEKVTVAGIEGVRKGFKVCKHCGKVQSNSKKVEHSIACPSRDKDGKENIEECLYLYREFASEAIRILIPATTFEGSETRLQSFVAALMLGLKRFFGSVEHLKVCICEEPVKDSAYRKNYLVLYDSVPGGTGYLKQLMKTEKEMIQVFEKALQAIKACSCANNPDKDGCYRCLYAYKQSRFIGNISRKAALEILNEILKNKDRFVQIQSIEEIAVNSLFDSELERRFLEAINRSKTEERPIELKSQIVNQKQGYYLQIGERTWEIEPQVELGIADGVAINTRADFVIRPLRNRDKNIKPIVVYTDGYVYHKEQVGLDFAKRMAITRSGDYWVWSLSWKDVEHVFYNQGNYYSNLLNYSQMPNGSIYKSLAEQYQVESFRPHQMNSFELLLKYLAEPEKEEQFLTHAFICSLCLCDLEKSQSPEALLQWKDNLRKTFGDLCDNLVRLEPGQSFFGKWSADIIESNVQLYSGISHQDLGNKKRERSVVFAVLEDRQDYRNKNYEADWNGFLRMYNLLQFLPESCFVTMNGLEQGLYHFLQDTVRYEAESAATVEPEVGADVWQDVIADIIDETCLEIARELRKTSVPPPDVIGYELVDSGGDAIIGEAEVVWVEQKVAILRDDQLEFLSAFAERGWKVYCAKLEIIPELKQSLTSTTNSKWEEKL